MKVTHPNSLDLDPQDGDLELLAELKRHFGFEPTAEQCRHWLTLGDIHAALTAALPYDPEGACPSQRVFHLLRKAILMQGIARADVRPSTSLDHLEGDQPRRWLRHLEQQSGLAMPWPPYEAMGQAGSILFLIGFFGGVVVLVVGKLLPSFALFAAMLLGLLLMWRDKGSWPAGVVTLGDLTERVAALNHHKLDGVRDLPDTLWQRLTALVAEQSLMAPQDMRADTLLFAPRKSFKERLADPR